MPSSAFCMRRGLLAASLFAPLMGWSLPAMAQAFPSKPLRIVVPFAAGGAGDLTARIVGAELSASLGQPVTIENRPGAGGVVAAETVARAEPDGHTLFLMSNGTAVTASLFKSLPYDTLKDLAAVSTLGTFDLAVVVPADSPFKTLGELVAFAKAIRTSSTSAASTSAVRRTWRPNCSSPAPTSTRRSCRSRPRRS